MRSENLIGRRRRVLRSVAPSLLGAVVAVAMLGSACSDGGSATLTLCSQGYDPIDFVVTADKAEPARATGSLAPGARVTLRFQPRSEGAYAVELRRGDEVVRHASVGYYTPRADSSVTITDDLKLTLGCAKP